MRIIQFTDIEEAYQNICDNFAFEERRDKDKLLSSLANGIILRAYEDEKLIGQIFLIRCDGFYLLEHISIEAKYRGRKFGSQFLGEVLKSYASIVLEAKTPKRIHFYKQLGFEVFDGTYLLPPLHQNGKFVPYPLMSYGLQITKKEIESIYKNVYHLNPDQYPSL